MPDKRAPSVRARQLAAELRRLRDEARLTGEEVGERLGWSPAKVSRIETARTAITAADLASLPEGVTIDADPDLLLVHVTSRAPAAEPAPAEAESATQPEVIKPERREKEE